MTDNESQISSISTVDRTRRQALKLFGLGAVAGVAGVIGISQAPEVNKLLPTPESRLKSHNLEEFIPLYQSSKEFSQKFGILPPLFQNLQKMLFEIANGNNTGIDINLLQKFSSEWGTKKEELPQVAQNIYEQLEYPFDPSVSEREQRRVKAITKNVCQSFPMLAVAAPKVVQYGDTPDILCQREEILGCTDGENFIHAGNKGETNFAEILIHEWNHNFLDDFDNDENFFQYVNKQDVVRYFQNTTQLLDNFYTSVASDNCQNPMEFMFGYNKWDERQAAISLSEGCRTILGIDSPVNVEAASATALFESPQYNMILRESLRRLLFEKESLTESEKQQLSTFISKEMQFAMHALHSPVLRDRIIIGLNPNSILQQFLDLNSLHQREWVSLASSGQIQGTISPIELRQKCGLIPNPENNLGYSEIPQMFDYEEFGCSKIKEGLIAEDILYEIHELPEASYDNTNKYIAWEFFDSVYTPENGNHIVLFSVPQNVDVSGLQVAFNDGIACLIFPDGKKVSVTIEIESEDDGKKTGIDSSNITNDLGVIENIWKKEKVVNKQLKWTKSNIGEVGPLGNFSSAPNINCVLTSNPDLPYTHFYAAGESLPSDDLVADIVFFTETAAIIPTADGFRLMFRALPTNLISDMNRSTSIDQVLNILSENNSELIGEEHFKKHYNGQDIKSRITSKFQKTSEDNTGIIYSIIVGNGDRINEYPIETKAISL